MTLSDRVVIMHKGRIVQTGTPQEVYAYPASRFVADFIGKANFLESHVVVMASGNALELDIMGNKFIAATPKSSFSEGERVLLVLRPESVKLEPKRPDTLTGTVCEAVYLGSQMVYEVDVAKKIIIVEVANPHDCVVFRVGEEVTLTFQEKTLHIIPYEEES
jgi:iron(III) transport system ATP-binding protein